MWKVFPKFGLLKLFFFAFSTLFLTVLVLFLPTSSGNNLGWSSFSDALTFVVPVMIPFLGLVYAVGRWGWLLLWKTPGLKGILHRKVCPNLNGAWDGLIESTHVEDGSAVIKEVTLEIQADLFGFNIELKSDDGYQSSRVVQCDLVKDPKNKQFYLLYIFESKVWDPQPTDDEYFQGAARLSIHIQDNGVTELEGTYWTNRKWRENKQTAGRLTATRRA